MKRRISLPLALAIAMLSTEAMAQEPPAAAPAVSEADAERDAYLCRSTRLTWVLAGWSAASIATGAGLWASAGDDDFQRHIGIQNVVWGGVDGAIATVGLIAAYAEAGDTESAAYWRARRAFVEKVYWVNAAIDIAYVATGTALLAFGKRDDVRGAGAGILLQGGFLLGFDVASGIVMMP